MKLRDKYNYQNNAPPSLDIRYKCKGCDDIKLLLSFIRIFHYFVHTYGYAVINRKTEFFLSIFQSLKRKIKQKLIFDKLQKVDFIHKYIFIYIVYLKKLNVFFKDDYLISFKKSFYVRSIKKKKKICYNPMTIQHHIFFFLCFCC